MTAQTPIVNAGVKYVNGLNLAKSGNKTITMSSGAARDSSNTNDIILNSTITIDGNTVGANGVDLAVITNRRFYAVYVIGDSTLYQPTAGLLSLSATDPNLPAGYDMYRRVGWILTDNTPNISQFWQYGNGQFRPFYHDVGLSELSGGSATTFTAVSLVDSVPAIVTQAVINYTFTPGSAAHVAEFLPFGSVATSGIIRVGSGVAAAQVGMITVPSELDSGVPKILYKVGSGDTLSLSVVGFVDYLS